MGSTHSSTNTLVATNVYLGSDCSLETLCRDKIVRMITFYAGVVVVDVLPDGTISDGVNGKKQHCGVNEPNYLQHFRYLCYVIDAVVSDPRNRGESVLLFIYEDHPKDDISRAYILAEAWNIENRHEENHLGREDRKKIVKGHKKQLEVWTVLCRVANKDQRDLIYDEWLNDLSNRRNWRRIGV